MPEVWAIATPERFRDVRLAAVDEALHRLLGVDVLASAVALVLFVADNALDPGWIRKRRG